MKTTRTTDSFHFSNLLLHAVLTVIVSVLPARALAQWTPWYLPQQGETVRANSLLLGFSEAIDTYFSDVHYMGPLLGMVSDSWKGYRKDRFFNYGRSYSNVSYSSMTNNNGGGSTLELSSNNYMALLRQVVDCKMDNLLVGPAVMSDIGVLYNMQNQNNPIDLTASAGFGFCVDNTFRFRVFKTGMALQATLFVHVIGMGFVTDYDQPYWFIYRYGEYGKNLHLFKGNRYLLASHQTNFIIPLRNSRLRIGFSFDNMSNGKGDHYRRVRNSFFSVGFVKRFETKKWTKWAEGSHISH